MSFIKKISVIVIAVYIFSVSLTSLAQEVTTDTSYNGPEIYVKDLILDKTSFQAGETIKGSFTIGNDSAYSISDIHYEIRLADKYKENGLAGDFYDYKSFGPLYFTGNESKKISFDYILPKTISGNGLGIQVRAVLGTGGSLGWTDAKITVYGINSFLNIDTAEIVSGEKIFRVQAGPTIKEGKEASLQFEVKNPNKTPVTYITNIKIYERATDKLLSNINLATSSLSSGSTKLIKYTLPKISDISGVYVGKVTVNDGTGSLVAPAFEFRYIIAGPLVTINNLVIDSLSAYKGQVINGILSYSGSAPDIENPEAKAGVQNYNLSIKIFSQENVLVGEYEDTVNFNQGVSKNFSIKTLVAAKQLRSEVVIKDGDKIITQYSSSFPVSDNNQVAPDISQLGALKWLGIIVMILGMFLVIWVLFRFTLLKKSLRVLAVTLLILSGSLIVLQIVIAGAYGGVTYIAPWPLKPTISVSVNSTVGWDMVAGQAYRIYGSVWSSACGNETVTTNVYVDGAVVGSGVGGQFCKNSCTRAVNFDYASGWKYAPTNGGNFCNSVKAETFQGNSGLAARWEGGGCGTSPVITNNTLTVTKAGTGSGTITSSVINCGNTCSQTVASGTAITLTATASSGTFTGWSGACTGTGTCTVVMNTNKTVNATFVVTSAVPTCSDGIKNQNETGIDTGGVCGGSNQTCSDGIKNQNETGIDTGGACGGGGSNQTCSDGIKNQNETGIDTGGACGVNPLVAVCGGNVGSYLSSDTNYRSNNFCTPPSSLTGSLPSFPQSGTTTLWTCGGSGTTAVSCQAYRSSDNTVIDTSLNCSLGMTNPLTSPVNVNTNTTWSFTPSVGQNLTFWTISDSNGTTTSQGTSNTMDKIFTTTGLKTVTLRVASSSDLTHMGDPCTSTVNIVQEGGSIRER